jgi:hypothetical protein
VLLHWIASVLGPAAEPEPGLLSAVPSPGPSVQLRPPFGPLSASPRLGALQVLVPALVLDYWLRNLILLETPPLGNLVVSRPQF